MITDLQSGNVRIDDTFILGRKVEMHYVDCIEQVDKESIIKMLHHHGYVRDGFRYLNDRYRRERNYGLILVPIPIYMIKANIVDEYGRSPDMQIATHDKQVALMKESIENLTVNQKLKLLL